MALYQRTVLATGEHIGDPAPLPFDLIGSLTDADLAHLSDFGPAEQYAGQGFIRVADPVVPAPRYIHKAVFLQRLPAAVRIAIRTASKTDVLIEDFLDVLYATDQVDLDNENLTAGVAYMETEGLLTSDQAAALLA